MPLVFACESNRAPHPWTCSILKANVFIVVRYSALLTGEFTVRLVQNDDNSDPLGYKILAFLASSLTFGLKTSNLFLVIMVNKRSPCDLLGTARDEDQNAHLRILQQGYLE